jgi:pantetheine-phosphate adenylyltransferase
LTKAVYPGSFDPITHGHSDLVERAARQFDQVVVAIANNVNKQTMFTIDERVELAAAVLAHLDNVTVEKVSGVIVDFAQQHSATAILRGLRAVSDFEFEFQLASMNRNLKPDIETLFMIPAEHYTYVSSSLVKEVAKFNGDVSEFLHPLVLERVQQKLAKQ